MIKIDPATLDSPRKMSQAVVQAADMLGLLGAELASILGLLCNDVGRLRSGAGLLVPGSEHWQQAEMLLQLYCRLYEHMAGDSVAMRHWLRSEDDALGGVPLLLLVDDKKLPHVLALKFPEP